MTSEERIQRNMEEQKLTKKEVSGTSGKCGELERTWAVTQVRVCCLKKDRFSECSRGLRPRPGLSAG